MKAAKFDLREVQRVIYNSKTYQAGASPTPDLGKAKYLFNGPLVRRLSAEQVWDSLIVTAVGTYADNVLLRRGDDLKAMALPAGKVTLAEIKNAVDRTKTAFSGGGKAAGSKKAAGGSALGLANGYDGDKPVSRFSLMLARASELPQPSPETHFLRLWGQGDRLLADAIGWEQQGARTLAEAASRATTWLRQATSSPNGSEAFPEGGGSGRTMLNRKFTTPNKLITPSSDLRR